MNSFVVCAAMYVGLSCNDMFGVRDFYRWFISSRMLSVLLGMEGGGGQNVFACIITIVCMFLVQPVGSGGLPACWSIHGVWSSRSRRGELPACRSLHGMRKLEKDVSRNENISQR